MTTFYVQESLGRGEKLIRFGRFHWIYDIQAAMAVFWGAIIAGATLWGAVFLYRQTGTCPVALVSFWGCVPALHWGIKTLVFVLFAMGLWGCLHMMVVKISTEIAVTNRRLIFKRGLVSRQVEEMNIDRIEGVEVSQGILGRILGYGRVVVHGMGIGRMVLPTMANPVVFRKAVQWARNHQEEEDHNNGRNRRD
ncbi:MAG: PH domain-containing protein [Alphaproteobacteria bacterium]|nr:PH domain-containing protein [Alphaproteobacteria bacterium]